MTENGTEHTEEKLMLRSRLSDLAQVPPWTERLASQHAIPDNVHYAIDLCLEEVLSNIILHAYDSESDRPLTVRFTIPRQGCFVVIVEDEAPTFDPLAQPELPALTPRAEIRIGGQGIRLLRQFADIVEYQPLPAGNRLTMSFSTAASKTGTD